jgi:peptidyl-prolyl cis-trans isomerase A (cyclophilin A)
MRHFLLSIFALVAFASGAPAAPKPAPKAAPGLVRVRLVTSEGAIVLALDARHAPLTTANFLAYVDDGRLDGTNFYRAARSKGAPKLGFIQGGVGTDVRRFLPPVPLEPTSKTGLHHDAWAISMAHGDNPNSATCNFTISTAADPSLDAKGKYPGYAAFGHVVSGMDVVRRILAAPSGGGTGAMRGQMLVHPVQLISAQRLDGVAKPSGHVKPWLIGPPR